MKKNGVAETVTTTNLSNSDNTMNIKAGDAKVKTRSFNRSIHQRERRYILLRFSHELESIPHKFPFVLPN